MDDIFQGGVVGVGIDLAEVARISKMLDSYGGAFTDKTFSAAEVEYCSKKTSPAMHYAARFAAKEAVAKALGCGISGSVTLKGISVENDELGAPRVVPDGGVKKRMREIGAGRILISLTHTKEHAQAIALAIK